MATRTWIIGGTVVVALLAAGGWFALGGNTGGAKSTAGKSVAGAGPYQSEMLECQEEIMARENHNNDMELTPKTTWHQAPTAADSPVKVGGKYTKPSLRGKTPFSYECSVLGRRVLSVNTK